MADNQIATLISRPVVTFYTQEGTFPLVARDSNGAFPGDAYAGLNEGLLSFQIKNDASQDLPSAVITLEDNFAWNIIKPNDYVKIEMNYRSDAFETDVGHINNTCLFAGLVSDVRESFQGSSNQRMYTVTVQGLAKILQNVQLATFTEATQLSAYALLPDDAKKGIKFSGSSSAGIIYQILKRFILGDAIDDTQINHLAIEQRDTDSKDDDKDKKDKDKDSKDKKDDSEDIQKITELLYNFNTQGGSELGVKDLIHVNIEENKDETYTVAEGSTAQASVTKWSNYNGSILSMIKDVAATPFNELFWTHEEGKATLHYRPTPFDLENWEKLPAISIEPNIILSQEFSNSDQEQSAVFKLTAEEQAQSEAMYQYLYPLTNIELIQRYGYKTMSVSNDYFSSANKHETTQGVGGTSQAQNGQQQNAQQNYPPASQMMYVYNCIKDKNFSSKETYIPPELGGDSDYEQVMSLLNTCNNKDDFVSKCQSINPNIFKAGVAEQLWNQARGISIQSSGKNKLSHDGYLSIICPQLAQVAPKSIGSFSKLKQGLSAVKAHPKYSAEELMQLFDYRIGSKQAYEIAKSMGDGTFSESKYNQILSQYKITDAEKGVGAAGGSNDGNKVSELMMEYTRKLYNWYADNSKYYSGTVTINGTAGIEIGKRLFLHSVKDNLYYEFYIEAVNHSFSFEQGWTTSIGVTRGVQMADPSEMEQRRFKPPFSFCGTSTVFTGGYFGEESLKASIQEAKAKESSGSGSSGGGSGKGLAGVGKSLVGYFTYSQGTRTNIMKSGKNINDLHSKDDLDKNGTTDCSGFVWLCSKIAGNNVPSGMGWYTKTMADDARGSHQWLKEVSDKDAKEGDIVIYNTGSGAGDNGHTAILTEDYKGDSTSIVEMGGMSHGGVNESNIHDAFLSLLGGDKCLAHPIGGSGSSDKKDKD